LHYQGKKSSLGLACNRLSIFKMGMCLFVFPDKNMISQYFIMISFQLDGRKCDPLGEEMNKYTVKWGPLLYASPVQFHLFSCRVMITTWASLVCATVSWIPPNIIWYCYNLTLETVVLQFCMFLSTFASGVKFWTFHLLWLHLTAPHQGKYECIACFISLLLQIRYSFLL